MGKINEKNVQRSWIKHKEKMLKVTFWMQKIVNLKYKIRSWEEVKLETEKFKNKIWAIIGSSIIKSSSLNQKSNLVQA